MISIKELPIFVHNGEPTRLRLQIRKFFRFCRYLLGKSCCFFKVLPLQDKIVASTFEGRRYGDNSQFILEELHRLNPSIKIVWIKAKNYNYPIPDYISVVNDRSTIRKAYEYDTAKVWLDTHLLDKFLSRRKKQLFVETWHGGLGIKKVGNDREILVKTNTTNPRIIHTTKNANLFVSNSFHLTNIFRKAFGYSGKIWKSGYPKNDILFQDNTAAKNKIHSKFGISSSAKICIYAPSFRDDNKTDPVKLKPIYSIDSKRLIASLHERFGGEWVILFRLHPDLSRLKMQFDYGESVKDATHYPDMQELILAADVFISDYSSCIFDASIRKIPCFTFATDFDNYKADRGVYYEMEELPFPYAKNNDELQHNILSFDPQAYFERLEAFKKRTGLHETGHATQDIAFVINEFIKGNSKPLEEIQGDLQ